MIDKLADLVAKLRRLPDVTIVEARHVEDRREQLRVRNQEVTAAVQARSAGVGVRVLVRGAWGFAATADPSPAAIEQAGRRAVDVAVASAAVSRRRVRLADEAPASAQFRSPREIDPFTVPLEQKVAALLEPSRRMLALLPAGSSTTAGMDWVHVRKTFVSSSGARIEQDTLHGGASVSCLVQGEGRPQRRSYPSYLDGDVAQGGYERIATLRLVDKAEQLGEEVQQLVKAPACPSGPKDVILEGSQLALQVHESCGHAAPLGADTGPAVSSLWLAAGSAAHDDLVKQLGRGVYVTRFHYVNGLLDTRRALMTGVTRDGTFLVEDGRLGRGVRNIRFTDSLLEALARTEVASRERRAVPSEGGAVVAPALLVRGFRFTGESAP